MGISSPDDQYGINPAAHTNAVNNDIFFGFYIYKAADFWDLRRTRNMMRLAGWTKHGIEAIAINPDGTDMDLNEARQKINNNELTTGDIDKSFKDLHDQGFGSCELNGARHD